jgi:hypothetical protein
MQRPRPCRYCGQMIVFALTPVTARRPFDAKPLMLWQLSGVAPNGQARQIPVHAMHECSEKRPA